MVLFCFTGTTLTWGQPEQGAGGASNRQALADAGWSGGGRPLAHPAPRDRRGGLGQPDQAAGGRPDTQALASGLGQPAASEVILPHPEIKIPSQLATVTEESWNPSASSVVVHIQDAHGHYAAQNQIKHLIDHLQKNHGFSLLLLEGSNVELDPSVYHFFKEPALNIKLADALMKEGELSGAEMHLIEQAENASISIRAQGIEKTELYREDFQLFRKVHALETDAGQFLNEVRSDFEISASKIFSAPLLKAMRAWRKFQEQRDIVRYTAFLDGQARKNINLDLHDAKNQKQFPQTLRLIRLKDIEPKIDRVAAGREAQKLAAFLSTFKEGASFAEQLESVIRTGSPARPARYFFEELYDAAAPHGFTFKDYPHLSLLAQYLVLQSEMDSSALFKEINRLSDDLFSALAKNDAERELVRFVKDLALLEKLFVLELTRDDYEKISAKPENLKPAVMRQRLARLGAVSAKPVPGRTGTLFDNAMEFYRLAEKREQAFFENIASRMKTSGQGKAILVTGGFHSAGMTEKFKEQGISFISVQPRFSDFDKEGSANYLTAMMAAKKTVFDRSQISKAITAVPGKDFASNLAGLTGDRTYPRYAARQILDKAAQVSPGLAGARPAARDFMEQTAELSSAASLGTGEQTPAGIEHYFAENPFWTDVRDRFLRLLANGDIDADFYQELMKMENIFTAELETPLDGASTPPIRYQVWRIRHNIVQRFSRGPLKRPAKGGIRIVYPGDLAGDEYFMHALQKLKEAGGSLADANRFLNRYMEQMTMALATDMSKKVALMGLLPSNGKTDTRLGGGSKGSIILARIEEKGGRFVPASLFGGRRPSRMELARIARATSRAYTQNGLVGIDVDVPAPDRGTDALFMTWMIDEYFKVLLEQEKRGMETPLRVYPGLIQFLNKEMDRIEASAADNTPYLDRIFLYSRTKHIAIPELGTYTGKPITQGGQYSRAEATGAGALFATELLLSKIHPGNGRIANPLKKVSVAVQGFGNAGQYYTDLMARNGARVVAVSDIGGGIYKRDGFDRSELDKLVALTKGGHSLSDYRESGVSVDSTYKPGNFLTDIPPVQVLVPAAREHVITEENAAGIKASAVVAVANGPSTMKAERILWEKVIPTIVVSDIFASGGGVAISYREMKENRKNRYALSHDGSMRWLKRRMAHTFHEIWEKMDRVRGIDFGYAADLVAIEKIRQAIRAASLGDEEAGESLVLPFKNILLIEEDRELRFVFQGLLEGLPGAQKVVAVGSGREGLEHYTASGDFDLIITDGMMGDMNGIEFMQAVRKLPSGQRPDVPIVIASAGEEYLSMAVQKGLTQYTLLKPFAHREIAGVLIQILKDNSGRLSPSEPGKPVSYSVESILKHWGVPQTRGSGEAVSPSTSEGATGPVSFPPLQTIGKVLILFGFWPGAELTQTALKLYYPSLEVSSFTRAPEAMEAIRLAAEQGHPFDLVFLAGKTDAMSSPEFLKRLRRQPFGSVRVLVGSGNEDHRNEIFEDRLTPYVGEKLGSPAEIAGMVLAVDRIEENSKRPEIRALLEGRTDNPLEWTNFAVQLAAQFDVKQLLLIEGGILAFGPRFSEALEFPIDGFDKNDLLSRFYTNEKGFALLMSQARAARAVAERYAAEDILRNLNAYLNRIQARPDLMTEIQKAEQSEAGDANRFQALAEIFGRISEAIQGDNSRLSPDELFGEPASDFVSNPGPLKVAIWGLMARVYFLNHATVPEQYRTFLTDWMFLKLQNKWFAGLTGQKSMERGIRERMAALLAERDKMRRLGVEEESKGQSLGLEPDRRDPLPKIIGAEIIPNVFVLKSEVYEAMFAAYPAFRLGNPPPDISPEMHARFISRLASLQTEAARQIREALIDPEQGRSVLNYTFAAKTGTRVYMVEQKVWGGDLQRRRAAFISNAYQIAMESPSVAGEKALLEKLTPHIFGISLQYLIEPSHLARFLSTAYNRFLSDWAHETVSDEDAVRAGAALKSMGKEWQKQYDLTWEGFRRAYFQPIPAWLGFRLDDYTVVLRDEVAGLLNEKYPHFLEGQGPYEVTPQDYHEILESVRASYPGLYAQMDKTKEGRFAMNALVREPQAVAQRFFTQGYLAALDGNTRTGILLGIAWHAELGHFFEGDLLKELKKALRKEIKQTDVNPADSGQVFERFAARVQSDPYFVNARAKLTDLQSAVNRRNDAILANYEAGSAATAQSLGTEPKEPLQPIDSILGVRLAETFYVLRDPVLHAVLMIQPDFYTAQKTFHVSQKIYNRFLRALDAQEIPTAKRIAQTLRSSPSGYQDFADIFESRGRGAVMFLFENSFLGMPPAKRKQLFAQAAFAFAANSLEDDDERYYATNLIAQILQPTLYDTGNSEFISVEELYAAMLVSLGVAGTLVLSPAVYAAMLRSLDHMKANWEEQFDIIEANYNQHYARPVAVYFGRRLSPGVVVLNHEVYRALSAVFPGFEKGAEVRDITAEAYLGFLEEIRAKKDQAAKHAYEAIDKTTEGRRNLRLLLGPAADLQNYFLDEEEMRPVGLRSARLILVSWKQAFKRLNIPVLSVNILNHMLESIVQPDHLNEPSAPLDFQQITDAFLRHFADTEAPADLVTLLRQEADSVRVYYDSLEAGYSGASLGESAGKSFMAAALDGHLESLDEAWKKAGIAAWDIRLAGRNLMRMLAFKGEDIARFHGFLAQGIYIADKPDDPDWETHAEPGDGYFISRKTWDSLADKREAVKVILRNMFPDMALRISAVPLQVLAGTGNAPALPLYLTATYEEMGFVIRRISQESGVSADAVLDLTAVLQQAQLTPELLRLFKSRLEEFYESVETAMNKDFHRSGLKRDMGSSDDGFYFEKLMNQARTFAGRWGVVYNSKKRRDLRYLSDAFYLEKGLLKAWEELLEMYLNPDKDEILKQRYIEANLAHDLRQLEAEYGVQKIPAEAMRKLREAVEQTVPKDNTDSYFNIKTRRILEEEPEKILGDIGKKYGHWARNFFHHNRPRERQLEPQLEATVQVFVQRAETLVRDLRPLIKRIPKMDFVPEPEGSSLGTAVKLYYENRGYGTRNPLTAEIVTKDLTGKIIDRFLLEADAAVFDDLFVRLFAPEKSSVSNRNVAAFNTNLVPALNYLGIHPSEKGSPLILEEGVSEGTSADEDAAKKIIQIAGPGGAVVLLWNHAKHEGKKPSLRRYLDQYAGKDGVQVRDFPLETLIGTDLNQAFKAYELPALALSTRNEPLILEFKGEKIKLDRKLFDDHGIDPLQALALFKQIIDNPPEKRKELFSKAGLDFDTAAGYWTVSGRFVDSFLKNAYAAEAARRTLAQAA